MHKCVLPTRLRWFGFLLIAVLGAIFAITLYRVTHLQVHEEILSREETIVKAEAANITSFFQVFGESVAVFAKLSHVVSQKEAFLETMNVFVEQWRDDGMFGGMLLTDENGVVRYNVNVLGTKDTGAVLSDRDYFLWAKSQSEDGKYFVGQPIVSRVGTSQGLVIVPVASPVFQNGHFSGVVVASVLLQPLAENYLGLMVSTEGSDIYLINVSGEILYSSSASEVVGSDFFRLWGSRSRTALSSKKSGEFQTKDHLMVYSPVELEGQNLSIIMVVPLKTVSDLSESIYVRQLAILLSVSLTFLLGVIIVKREKQIKKTKEDDQGVQSISEP